MGRRDSEGKKNGETRCEMKKKWGDKTCDKKNGEARRETKKMVRQDARQKKMG